MELDRTVLFGGRDQPRVMVLGLGESGLAMARWCAAHGCTLRLADSRRNPPNLATALALPGADAVFVSVLGNDAVDPFPVSALDDGVDLLAISPGLSPLDPAVSALLAAAAARDIPVWGELEFFSHALRAIDRDVSPRAMVIAITGTNGKTTTTALTGELVARAGRSVAVAGNISPSLLDRLSDAIAQNALPDVWVLELSSFQLETAYTFAPDAAVVLNVSQDHLDWHGGFEGYARAKFRIFGADTRVVLNRGDAACQAWWKESGRTAATFGADAPQQVGDFGVAEDGGLNWLAQLVDSDGLDGVDKSLAAMAESAANEHDGAASTVAAAPRRRVRRTAAAQPTNGHIKPLMPVDALRIRGMHNATNAMAALALCRAIGLSLAPLLHGLREYRGEPHRVESIAVIDGVDYVDDSKATNVGATVAALDGLASRIVLIAGGDGKGQDFSPLLPGVTRWCKAVMLIGRDAPLLRAALADSGVPLEDHESLEDATLAASRLAVNADVVLLSPACASLDMFRNYAHRAEVFRNGVHEIAAEHGVTL